MGNGSSIFKINKVCFDEDINIILEKEDLENDNNKDVNFKRMKSNHLKSIKSLKKQISINSNGINYKSELCQSIQQQNFFNSSVHINHVQDGNNVVINQNFTNLMQDLDISFSNQNGIEQNDVFNINYIKMKTSYNEDIIEYLNKIRTEPVNIINDIDNLKQIENEETHEKVILEDSGEELPKQKII